MLKRTKHKVRFIVGMSPGLVKYDCTPDFVLLYTLEMQEVQTVESVG